jgi:hypothetical protein
VHCGEGVALQHPHHNATIYSKTQSAVLTMGIKMPDTCCDTVDGIIHYLLHLVGLVLIHSSKMHGQTNIKFSRKFMLFILCIFLHSIF